MRRRRTLKEELFEGCVGESNLKFDEHCFYGHDVVQLGIRMVIVLFRESHKNIRQAHNNHLPKGQNRTEQVKANHPPTNDCYYPESSVYMWPSIVLASVSLS